MNLANAVIDQLSDALASVGFGGSGETFLGEGLPAKRWSSPYAHVYVVSVEKSIEKDWTALLDDVDRTVLNVLKSDELQTGGVLDAHVCFVIDDFSRRSIDKQVDEGRLRNVSRKYWIERAEGIGGFQSRLSLLGIDRVAELSAESSFGLSPNEQEWVDMLLDDGPESVYQRFLNKEGCPK